MNKRGKCPGCGGEIGPMAIFMSWDNWGRFICPGCGKNIAFKLWPLIVLILLTLFVILERVFHYMLVSDFSVWLTFFFSTIAGISIILTVPMMCFYKE